MHHGALYFGEYSQRIDIAVLTISITRASHRYSCRSYRSTGFGSRNTSVERARLRSHLQLSE